MIDKSALAREEKEQARVTVWLDSYDDLFSDFDPRSYSKRALSDDFIAQAKKLIREESRGRDFLWQLLLPASVRNSAHEAVIAERLPLIFSRSYEQLLLQRKKSRIRGIKMAGFGILLMVIGGYISFQEPEEFSVHLLLIIFEPAGWFLFWSGLDILLEYSRKTKKDLDFYRRISRTKIIFGSY
ncbi:hypothetical protein SAMN04488034_103125 [Salinimicrobium catena]|uniref:Uncharacterized protein n=1 Tax=Salinimicrobium catena TaxID=390640 RepID=A0A1H5MVE6_9FLAO|nr:hypothetical protein [Salinimicrobium catena]SDL30218.1 hypothetical protein SAMN04488140_103125 [Salinimicrobium catena]SEE93130.1 hypothetical protein SAMN04488034_103125 [Salinimicrobium catena]